MEETHGAGLQPFPWPQDSPSPNIATVWIKSYSKKDISSLCSKYHTPYHTHFTWNPRWRVSKI
jgi:hypothetical protein